MSCTKVVTSEAMLGNLSTPAFEKETRKNQVESTPVHSERRADSPPQTHGSCLLQSAACALTLREKPEHPGRSGAFGGAAASGSLQQPTTEQLAPRGRVAAAAAWRDRTQTTTTSSGRARGGARVAASEPMMNRDGALSSSLKTLGTTQ